MTESPEPGNGHRDRGTSRRTYIESGLAELGLETGPDEMAIIEVVDALYGARLDALMAEDFDGVPHEPGADMSKPPHAAEER